MSNKAVREYAKSKGVFLWQIAVFLGISEPTMTRRLRKELSEREQSEMLAAIDEIAGQKNTT